MSNMKNFKVISSVRIRGEHVEEGSIVSLDFDGADAKDLLASGRVSVTTEAPKVVEKPKPKAAEEKK